MIEFIYGGINTDHDKGEFCKKITFSHYSFFYFLTPFTHQVGDDFLLGNAGEALIIPPHAIVYHGPQKNMENGFKNDWFYANGKEIAELLSAFPLPINSAFPISSPELIKNTLQTLNLEQLDKRDGYKSKIDLAIKNMIIDLYRSYMDLAPCNTKNHIAYVRSEIGKNLTKKWTVEEMAMLSGYSVSRFSDLYNEKYGVSPKADLINMRLESSKRLLLYTTLSVDEIALQCGFGSIYHFSKIFKSIIGVSPSIYRHNAN